MSSVGAQGMFTWIVVHEMLFATGDVYTVAPLTMAWTRPVNEEASQMSSL